MFAISRARTLAACVLLAALQGCAALPPAPEAAAADPVAPTRPVAYRSVTGGYVSQRPVAPSAWREQNERVAPQVKP